MEKFPSPPEILLIFFKQDALSNNFGSTDWSFLETDEDKLDTNFLCCNTLSDEINGTLWSSHCDTGDTTGVLKGWK